MSATIIPIRYQDKKGFKTWGQIVVPGELTDSQRHRLTGTLGLGLTLIGSFIPEQVGHEHLGWMEPGFTTFPNQLDDHPWHEMFLEQALVVENDNLRASWGMQFQSIEQLLAAFETAAAEGWDENSFEPFTTALQPALPGLS